MILALAKLFSLGCAGYWVWTDQVDKGIFYLLLAILCCLIEIFELLEDKAKKEKLADQKATSTSLLMLLSTIFSNAMDQTFIAARLCQWRQRRWAARLKYRR